MSLSFQDLNGDPAIYGFLHEPEQANGNSVVLTHGAGANCQSKLLAEVSDALALAGFRVLRFDLPFRRARRFGPPSPGSAAHDRDGLRRAVSIVRPKKQGKIFLGGHSYGGRQASILCSEEPQLVDGLFLLSYPLHPPRKPQELRTAHFAKLKTPAFFAHGTRDPFGSIDELQLALKLIPAPHLLFPVEGVGHDLLSKKADNEWCAVVVREFQKFVDSASQ